MEFLIKNFHTHFEKVIFYGLSAAMITASVVLFLQYDYFRQETNKMMAVKEEYEYYLLMMKKNIKDGNCSQSFDSEEDNTEKKNENEDEVSSNESFLLVNRDPQYLKRSFDTFLDDVIESDDDGFQIVSAEDEKKLSMLRKQLSSRSKKTMNLESSIKKNSSVNNLRKLVRKAPNRDFIFHWPLDLHHFWISSLFGSRKNPNGTMGFHSGVDLAALKGTPVKAAASGVVVQAQYVPGYGNNILIQHSKNYRTRYAHLNSIGVKLHQKVAVGQQIGTVGDTGSVRKNGHDASHLHFEVYRNGCHVNPLRYLFT